MSSLDCCVIPNAIHCIEPDQLNVVLCMQEKHGRQTN